MKPVIVKNITKKYDETTAIENINFQVDRAQLFGLIGPDGAGKTTIFRILTSLLLPDKGEAYIEGLNVISQYRQVRQIIGYMPEKFSLYEDLSVEENLKFFASVFGTEIKDNYDLIKPIFSQLEAFKDRLARHLSGGMKQKLALSCALIHRPKVLILDEPTTGVDAVSRKEFWDMLKNLKSKGITILVSTPYMQEASLCDNIALIRKGEILKIDTPQNIINDFNQKLLSIKSNKQRQLVNDLRKYPYSDKVFSFGDSIHYTDKREVFDVQEIEQWLKEKKHSNIIIKEIKPNIEDCFIHLMKQ